MNTVVRASSPSKISSEIIGDIRTSIFCPQHQAKEGFYIVEGAVRDLNRAFNWSLPTRRRQLLGRHPSARMIPDVGQVFNFRLPPGGSQKQASGNVSKTDPGKLQPSLLEQLPQSPARHPFLQFECQNLVNHTVLLNP
jgi:hypothetical protein